MEGFNEKLFKEGETVCVALSGGEDSVCLLYLLKDLEKRLAVKVVALNVEHGIRGENSLRDALFCKELCKKLGVPLKSYSVDALALSKKDGLSVEEAARILRYESFHDALISGFCDKIALAHHQSDNVETVLFNVFRGASTSGLRGMEEVSYGGVIIRPLLYAKKSDITDYVRKIGAEFCKDETNDDVSYTRNFIRKEVLPLVTSRFAGACDAIERLSLSAKADDAYLYGLANDIITEKDGAIYLPITADYPVFSRAAVMAMKMLGVKKDFDNGHIGSLFALTKNQSGKRVDLIYGVYGIREGDYIAIKRKKEIPDCEVKFSLGEIQLKDAVITVKKTDGYKKDGSLYVDLDKIPAGAVVRRRRVGDVFNKFGGGKVSLKKFLTDKKIPKDKKDELYVVAKDEVIYVIVGVEISSLCKIDKDTAKAVKITLNNL